MIQILISLKQDTENIFQLAGAKLFINLACKENRYLFKISVQVLLDEQARHKYDYISYICEVGDNSPLTLVDKINF